MEIIGNNDFGSYSKHVQRVASRCVRDTDEVKNGKVKI